MNTLCRRSRLHVAIDKLRSPRLIAQYERTKIEAKRRKENPVNFLVPFASGAVVSSTTSHAVPEKKKQQQFV